MPQSLINTGVGALWSCIEDIVGSTEEPAEDYDLLEVIFIRRGDNAPEENDLFQYLEGVFTSDFGKMKKYVDMPRGSRIEKEARKMDGLGESLYMDGVSQGISQGLSQGISQGLSQGISQGLKALVSTLKTFLNTPEEILERVRENEGYENVTLEDIRKYY